MDTLKELLDQMYHISGVKETDKAVEYILSIVAAKDAEIAKLRAALEAVEFVEMAEIHSDREGAYYSAVQMCPWCMVDCRHAEDCQRQAALGLNKEAKDVRGQ